MHIMYILHFNNINIAALSSHVSHIRSTGTLTAERHVRHADIRWNSCIIWQ